MDLALDLDKRSGRLLGPFIALYSVERLALPDFVPDGTTVALLTPSGETLALALSQGHAVTLDTNTKQAAAYAAGLPVGRSLNAFVVVGDSDNLLATVPVLVVVNALDALAPPIQSAPHYPTSAELKAILAQMTEQANRAEDAVKATEEAQKAVAEYVDTTFPSKVEQAEKRLENATTSGVNSVTQRANQAVGALDQKQTQIISNIDTKAQSVNYALDGKLATANTSINEAVGKAETAKGDAVKAQGEASKSAEQASTSASNASKSADNAKTSEQNAKTTADALSAGLATLNSFDGRVTKLEDGRGAYKDPATGKVYFYTPCPVGDGTLVQLQTTGCIDRITLVEGLQKSVGISISKVSGDDFVIFCDGNTYVYDKTFNRIGKASGAWVFTMYRDGFIYRIESQKVQKRNVNGTNVGNANATVDSQGYANNFIGYNPKTGHIVAGKWSNNQYTFGIFDADLNAILDANNEPITKRGTVAVNWGYAPNSNRKVAQVWNTKNVLFFNDVCYGYDAALSCTLFMLDDNDEPIVVHESLPAFDEATGKTILEKDANGNLVKDARCYKPVIATNADGTPQTIRIKSREQIESSRVSSTAYYSILTPFTDRHGQTYLTNLVDEYVVYADGTIVDKYRYCKGNVESTTPDYSATKIAVKVNDLNNNKGALRLVYANAGTDVSQGGRSEVALLAVWSSNGCFYTGYFGHNAQGVISVSEARTQIFFVNPSILYQNDSPQTANGARYGLWKDVLFKHNASVRGGSK